MRAAITIIYFIYTSMVPALAETLTGTDWQGVRTCSSPHGYLSHETQWQDRIYGDDNRGTRWSTSRWQDREITTITPPER